MCDIHCGKIRCQLQGKKTIKNTNIRRLNNILLNNQQITEKNKICIEANENNPKPMEFSKSSAKGKVHSNTSLPQETREKSNNLTLHLKQLEKEEVKNPRVSRRKEILKIRAEINEKQRRP